ncbi:MAG: MotA/TolQ/ExbB proton channel family protein [Prosthecobacter sp.]|nr:MotA/TolQ/ExbB proton channel family protein [Prosthecobacter sp.]
MNASSNKGALLARIGVWMQVAQVVGVAFTVWGMMHAFEVLGASTAADPARLSGAIGVVLYSTAGGVAAGLVGCIFLTISITTYHYREPWIFWFLLTYGLLCTPFGLFFLVYCLIYRDEFLRPIQTAAI